MITEYQKRVWTEDALLALPKQPGKCELINGELIQMAPAGFDHGDITCAVLAPLTTYVITNHLGRVVDGQTGFWMKSGNLLSPDMSFVGKSRLLGLKRGPKGFFKGSPDLAVEILSPTQSKAATNRKIREYFENDTEMAWVIDPPKKQVYVYRGSRSPTVFGIGDYLDGEDVVPGFRMPVAELFKEFTFEA